MLSSQHIDPRRVRRVGVALVALLVLSACSSRVSGTKASTAAAADGPTTTAAPKSTVVIGEVGDFSSIVGASLAPSRDAVQAWVADVNARGGLDGHPVKLLVGDDGGDATKSMALAKDFVENQGAIALVNYVGAGVATIPAYAEAQRVPVIGGLPDESWFDSWAMFPTQPPQATYGYAEAAVSADQGVSKVAALYCSEAPVCKDSAQGFITNAPAAGLDLAYEAAISIVQPDFTAECLQAKAKGVELILPVTDGNSITRLAQSCARQDYHPTFLNLSPTTEQAAEPELDGMIAVLRDFPWFLTTGKAALVEYGKATDGQERQFQSAIGWTAGKLLERATAHLPANPTSEDVLTGLWGLRHETLGGLIGPVTFTKQQPVTPADCAFVVKVVKGEWTAPDGLRRSGCRGK